MLVSVIIIFYNQSQYVSRALRSVTQQTYKNLDIIVVDDGSEESIAPLVEDLQDSRIRFIRKENGGAASARNRGIVEARGEYVFFLDGDDVYLPSRVGEAIAVLRSMNKPKCMIACGAYAVAGGGFLVGHIKPESFNPGDWINTSLVRPSCTGYHSALFTEVGLFPEHMESNEDGALNATLGARYPVFAISKRLVLYRMDDNGLARRFLRSYESAVEIMQSKLSYIEERVDPALYEVYREQSYRDLLFGFLSRGTLSAAKKWRQVASLSLDRTAASFVAMLSVKTGINGYRMIRVVRQFFICMGLLPLSVRLHRYLKL